MRILINSEEFRDVVRKWSEEAKVAPINVVRDSLQELNNQIIATTPVDTGFLRGSYFASKEGAPSGEGSIGRSSTAAVNVVVATLQPGESYYMGNTAAYAMRLEFGFVGTDSLGRSYNQAGRFWFAAAIGQMEQIVQASIARLSTSGTPDAEQS